MCLDTAEQKPRISRIAEKVGSQPKAASRATISGVEMRLHNRLAQHSLCRVAPQPRVAQRTLGWWQRNAAYAESVTHRGWIRLYNACGVTHFEMVGTQGALRDPRLWCLTPSAYQTALVLAAHLKTPRGQACRWRQRELQLQRGRSRRIGDPKTSPGTNRQSTSPIL